MNSGDRNSLRCDQGADHGVKLRQHLLDFVGSMRRDIYAHREGFALTAQHQRGNIGAQFDFRQRLRQLFHHRNIDDVQRSMMQCDSRHRRMDIDEEPSQVAIPQRCSCCFLSNDVSMHLCGGDMLTG